MRRSLTLALLLSGIASLQACAPLVVGAAAVGTMAATDNRSLGSQIDDQAIEIKATTAIAGDESLKPAHLNITSVNGVVLLTGEAPTEAARERALALVRDINGVRRTINELRVAQATPIGSRGTDTWITSKVKARLIATREVDSTKVKVVTENAVVYLMGLVEKDQGDLVTDVTTEVAGIERIVKLFEYVN